SAGSGQRLGASRRVDRSLAAPRLLDRARGLGVRRRRERPAGDEPQLPARRTALDAREPRQCVGLLLAPRRLVDVPRRLRRRLSAERELHAPRPVPGRALAASTLRIQSLRFLGPVAPRPQAASAPPSPPRAARPG